MPGAANPADHEQGVEADEARRAVFTTVEAADAAARAADEAVDDDPLEGVVGEPPAGDDGPVDDGVDQLVEVPLWLRRKSWIGLKRSRSRRVEPGATMYR